MNPKPASLRVCTAHRGKLKAQDQECFDQHENPEAWNSPKGKKPSSWKPCKAEPFSKGSANWSRLGFGGIQSLDLARLARLFLESSPKATLMKCQCCPTDARYG